MPEAGDEGLLIIMMADHPAVDGAVKCIANPEIYYRPDFFGPNYW